MRCSYGCSPAPLLSRLSRQHALARDVGHRLQFRTARRRADASSSSVCACAGVQAGATRDRASGLGRASEWTTTATATRSGTRTLIRMTSNTSTRRAGSPYRTVSAEERDGRGHRNRGMRKAGAHAREAQEHPTSGAESRSALHTDRVRYSSPCAPCDFMQEPAGALRDGGMSVRGC